MTISVTQMHLVCSPGTGTEMIRLGLSNGSKINLSKDAHAALGEYYAAADSNRVVTRVEIYTEDHQWLGNLVATSEVSSHLLPGCYIRRVRHVNGTREEKILPAGRHVPTKVWQRVDCPKCNAKAGKRCRTLTTKRVTDTHKLRFELSPIFEKEEYDRTWRAK